ncbi:MAG: hypothetical protein U9R48_07800 [Chloroflexota bacterium]|nr:hypothetical protein [Chloroflexota bacterium]
MRNSLRGDFHTRTEPETTAIVAACRRLFREARGCVWQSLWVVSGFCLVAILHAERFVGDFAETVERRRLQAGRLYYARRWSSRVTNGVTRRLSRFVGRRRSGMKACRRLATQIDENISQRRDDCQEAMPRTKRLD